MAKSEWAKTTRLVEAARRVLALESPMTVRQCFYALVSIGEVENCLRGYQRVSKALTKARDDGRVSFDLIVDRSRPVYKPTTFDDLKEYGEAVLTSYRRDNWQDQPRFIDVWTEKDAIVGSIEEVTQKWAVRLRALRGFFSTTNAHRIAELFRWENRIGKQIAIFYVGDFDPSGEAIEQDVQRRVLAYGSGPFSIRRLAIHRTDIQKFHLPPLRVKLADPRANGFIQRHGRQAVELDALPPTELRRRISQAIRGLVDMNAWRRALAIEQAQRETTERIAQMLSTSPDGPERRI
jgi:hypothetical protein